MGPDQVVAVHSRRHRHLFERGLHELEDGHLSGGILHRHPVGPELQVGLARYEVLPFGIIEVPEDDLLRQGERPLQSVPHHLEVLLHPLVDGLEIRCGGFNPWHGSFLTIPYPDVKLFLIIPSAGIRRIQNAGHR